MTTPTPKTLLDALTEDARTTQDHALAAHVAAQLAPHKRPRRICFVAELPRTRAAKLDRRALITLAPMLKPLPLPHEH